MSFFSFTFILFLLIVISCYWLVSYRVNNYTAKLQNAVILLSSIVFVGFVHTYFVLVLLGYAFFVYLAQRAINEAVKKNLTKHLNIARDFSQQEFSLLVANFCKNKGNLSKLEKNLDAQANSLDIEELIKQSAKIETTQNISNNLVAIKKILLARNSNPDKEFVNYRRLIATKIIDFYAELYRFIKTLEPKTLHEQDIVSLNQYFKYADSLLKELNLTSTQELSKNYKNKSSGYEEVITQRKLTSDKFFKNVNKSLIPGYGFAIVLFISLLPLIYFKYYDFIYLNIVNFMSSLGFSNLGELVSVIPVLGISYYTFNCISLLVSVKRGEVYSPSLLTT
ncbi:hypothetical protein, partial [Psittacicella gerlachiana]